jgi:hypothetical protein
MAKLENPNFIKCANAAALKFVILTFQTILLSITEARPEKSLKLIFDKLQDISLSL